MSTVDFLIRFTYFRRKIMSLKFLCFYAIKIIRKIIIFNKILQRTFDNFRYKIIKFMEGQDFMFKISNVINFLGITAFILLCLTFFLGITQISYNLHIIIGGIAFLFSCLYAGFIVWFNYKRKKGR